MKERDQLITKAQPAPAADANKGSVQQLPGGIIAKPPSESNVKAPVEAVTRAAKVEAFSSWSATSTRVRRPGDVGLKCLRAIL